MKLSAMKKILRDMKGRRVAVIGDLMVDEYVYGETNRISREAPVLILRYRERKVGYGGAANAIANIRALGGIPVPVGVVGDDENGQSLLDMFKSDGIETGFLQVVKNGMTTSKTRIMAGGMHTLQQQIVRIDREDTNTPDASELITNMKSLIAEKIDGILVSDYGAGVLSSGVINYINRLNGKERPLIAIDSRYNLKAFKNADLLAPNEEEAGIGKGTGADDLPSIEKACEKLRDRVKGKALMVTRGSEGLSLFVKNKKPLHIPVYGSKSAVDTTGAGDTVVSSALLTLCAGGSFEQAAQISNRAGGLVVMKKGAATISPSELLDTLDKK